jgi:histidinol-phosphatase (PHP family)
VVEWDFLIGSVHYLPGGWEVDHPKYVGRHAGHAEEVWLSYWGEFEACIRTGLFDFMGHPDLPKKFGFRPEGDLRRFYEPAIAALAEMKMPFEINTAGWRKECNEQYPAREFVELAYQAGVPLLINSDSHSVEELGAGFAEAVKLAREAGYTQTARFHKRKMSLVPLP